MGKRTKKINLIKKSLNLKGREGGTFTKQKMKTTT